VAEAQEVIKQPQGYDGDIAGRYSSLEAKRSQFLNRAREASELTIPTLIPHEGSQQEFPTPYQSLGARAVNNLAAKSLLALFPPEAAFMRLQASKDVVKDAEKAAGGKDVLAEIQLQLQDVETEVQTAMEGAGMRPTLFTALRHLIVGGNGLLHVLPDNRLQFFPLSQYVVRRDLQGNLLEIIVKQTLQWNSLPQAVQKVLSKDPLTKDAKVTSADVDLYTRVWLDTEGRRWKVVQEACGISLEETRGTYLKDKNPWITLRWTEVPGEDYGRGHVEEYIGDLSALEGLSKAIIEGALGASKLLWLIDPASPTSRQTLAEADNLDFVEGNAKDISTLQTEKFGDFQVARAAAEAIELRLSQAFLLGSAVQRQAERVTAEEIRVLIAELESSLGGLYSLLSKDLQRPLAVVLMWNLEKKGKIPNFKPGTVDLHIITGLDALGRTNDQRNLTQYLLTAREALGDKLVEEWIDGGAALNRLAVSSRIEPKGLIRTEEQVQQARQAQMNQELRTKLGPPAIKAASDQMAASPTSSSGT
jgi:hypothetical protein